MRLARMAFRQLVRNMNPPFRSWNVVDAYFRLCKVHSTKSIALLLIQHFHILHVLCNRYNCVALTLVFYDIQGTCCVLPGAYCKLISKSHDIAQNGHSLRQYLNKRVATEIRFNANSFSIYATYSATSCQRLSGNCYANIKFCNIFMMVQCIQTALPLLAWFFGENIQRLILFSGVLSQKLYDNYIAF